MQVLGSRRLKPVLLRANIARLLYSLVARVIPNILYLITPLRKEVPNVNKLFVGLDLSLKDYKVSIIDQNGAEVVKTFSVINDQVGADILIDTILRCCKALAVDTLVSSALNLLRCMAGIYSIYWLIPSAYALSPPYYLLTPSSLKTSKILGNLPKNDWVDANTIAERLPSVGSKSCPGDFRYLALQTYSL